MFPTSHCNKFLFTDHISYSRGYVSSNLKQNTSFQKLCYFEALYAGKFMDVGLGQGKKICRKFSYNGFITCPSLLEATGIRVPVKSIWDFNILSTSCSCNNYPYGGCALTENKICNNLNIFCNQFFTISLLVNVVTAFRYIQYNCKMMFVLNMLCACTVSVLYVCIIFFYYLRVGGKR